MHLHKYYPPLNILWLGCAGVLLSGGNWNNATNAGIRYRNSNNSPANVNANLGSHLELKTRLRSPEQQPIQNQIRLVKHKATHPRGLVHTGKLSWNGRAEP